METMSLFFNLDEHEQIKNLHNRINHLKLIEKSHQKLNGELSEEIKILKNNLDIKDKEMGRMMNKINKLEKLIPSYQINFDDFCKGE